MPIADRMTKARVRVRTSRSMTCRSPPNVAEPALPASEDETALLEILGPGAGKLVADIVSGDPTLVDPTPFRLTRFTDGSNPRPHPLAS